MTKNEYIEILKNRTGSKNPAWKGGLPSCSSCGKQVSEREYSLCLKCSLKLRPRNSKGGITLTPDYAKKSYRLWVGKNRSRKYFINGERRARKMNAEGSHTLAEWEHVKEIYHHMCLCCKRFEPEIVLSEDHIIPLSKGGTDYIWNIQPLCRSCNSRKNVEVTDYRRAVC